MDGIGGLIIGHIFKIPEELLPRGYKGETLGSKLGHIVTSIGHSVSNNDWTTNIDAQTIVLDNPLGANELEFNDILTKDDRYKNVVAARKSVATQNFRINPKKITGKNFRMNQTEKTL
jgi:hypothetical protein